MYEKTTLSNGLRIVTSSMPHAQSASLGLYVATGARYEDESQSGASHFIEHMVFKGTEKRLTAQDIALAIEGVGGVLNASTDAELTVYYTRVPYQHSSLAMDVLADLVLNPLFPAEEMEKERQVILEEIKMSMDAPQDWVHHLFSRLMWPDNPLGRDVAGSMESVKTLSRDALMSRLRTHYKPGNTVVAVAGRIEHQTIVDEVQQQLGKWQSGSSFPYQPVGEMEEQPQIVVEVRPIEQANFCVGVPGLSRDDPDRFVLGLLNTVLGEGMSSRLFQELRERRGLAYLISSYNRFFHDTGVTAVYGCVAPSRMDETLRSVLEEWRRLREELISDDELSKAKEFTRGRLQLRADDTSSVGSWLGGQETLRGEILTIEQVMEVIDAITADDVRRVAERVLGSEQRNLSVVGPADDEEKLLALLRN
jgi:predicted Zn-dependent peptidase